MPNLWSNKLVAIQPLWRNGDYQGCAIVSSKNKIFYGKDTNIKALLKEVKDVITWDSYQLQKYWKDWNFFNHNFKTLYFQVKSQIRFQSPLDLLREELFVDDVTQYSYIGCKPCGEYAMMLQVATFMLQFYKEHYKEVNKEILKLDNELLKIAKQDHLIDVDYLQIRTRLSEFQLRQWRAERVLFNEVGYPIISPSQLPFTMKDDPKLLNCFETKNKYKAKYDSLVRYLDCEQLNLEFDVTASATGRIICRDEATGMFAPDNEFKEIFTAQEGYTLISADYSKQEAMILAYVTHDKTLNDDLKTKNYYAALSNLLLGERDKQKGKTLFYSLLYGMKSSNLAIELNVDEDLAFSAKNRLKRRYAIVTQWLKHVTTLKENFYGRKLYTSTANAYIQSTAADIIRMKLIETKDYNPIAIFSDNIIYAVQDKNVKECKEKLKTILEDITPFNISVTIKSSKNLKFI